MELKQLLLYNLLYYLAPQLLVVHGQKSKATPKPIPVKFHEQHRHLPWCVTGVDEPEFQHYPLSEFQGILQRSYTEPFKANERYKYMIDLKAIKNMVKDSSWIGKGGVLFQRAHFVFKSLIRREFAKNVFASYNESEIEGLIVQANYAPYGVGLPTGYFMHPNEFNCHDCNQPIGIPVACKKRTYMHIMHPTILVYHHRMVVPETEKQRRYERCRNTKIPNQCIITGFNYVETAAEGGSSTETSGGDAGGGKGPTGSKDKPPNPFQVDKMIGYPIPHELDTCDPYDVSQSDCLTKFKDWYKTYCCPFQSAEDPAKCSNVNPASIVTGPSESGGASEAPAAPGPAAPAPGAAPAGPAATAPPFIIKPMSFCPKDKVEENFNDPSYEPTFECRPYTINLCRKKTLDTNVSPWETEEDLKQTDTDDKTFKAAHDKDPFERYKLDDQCCELTLPKPPPGSCPPPPPCASPSCPPQFPKNACPIEATPNYPDEVACTPRIVLPFDMDTKIEAPVPDLSACNELKAVRFFGRKAEIHGNFVWYLPPCYMSSRIRFQMLVVHSFQRGVYSVIESEDYYDLLPAQKDSPIPVNNIPTPLFTGFEHTCDTIAHDTGSLFSKTFQDDPFDFSRSYDNCIQTKDKKGSQVCEGVPNFHPVGTGRKRNRLVDSKALKKASKIPKCDSGGTPANSYAKCADQCPRLEVSTELTSTTEKVTLIKRSLHGAINIVTNFCIMPICIFIARFYKETYNLTSVKGMKMWFWMHMIGAGGSTMLQYFGLFSKRYVYDNNRHVMMGDMYVLCLGMSYVTSWMRHKRLWISMIMQIIHVGCGYGCFFLALACVNNATNNNMPIGPGVKTVVYVASASLVVFYVGMTVHICSMDKKFGMKPRRLHFPTVETKFSDLPVPGGNIRKLFLVVLLWINLPLTICTLFL